MQQAIMDKSKSNSDVEKEVAAMVKLLDKGKYQQLVDRGWKFVDCWNNVKLTPEVSLFWKYMGLACFHTKDFKWSAECFGNEVKLFPNDDEGYAGRGMANIAAGKIDVALKDLNKALDMNPDNVNALILISLGYASKGESKKANEFIQKAASKDKELTIGICTSLIDVYFNSPQCTETQKVELMKMKAQLKEISKQKK